MSTPKGAPIRGHAREGHYTTSWRFPNEESTLKPQTYGQAVRLYGEGLTMWDAWQWANRTIDVRGRKLQVIEEGHFWDALTVETEVPITAPGANLVVESLSGIGSKDYTIKVPPLYNGTAQSTTYRISDVDFNSGTGVYTYTMEALNPAFEVVVAIPIGQGLIVGHSLFAPGTRQPKGKVKDWFSHYHETAIIKTSIDYEGGQVALEEWEDLRSAAHGNSFLLRTLMEGTLRHRQQINDYILFGEKNEAGLTGQNRYGEDNVVGSDLGLINGMHQEAMPQFYTAGYTLENFEVLPYLFASQGVATAEAYMCAGQKLLGLIERNTGLLTTREFSGGTDLYDKLQGIGFGIQWVYINGIKTYLSKIHEFSNPTTYAINGFPYEGMGLVFPATRVTATLNQFSNRGASMGSMKGELAHMTIGYLSGDGEDRKLITANKAGMNGLGIPVSDDWDDHNIWMLSEVMTILLALNQTVLIQETN